MIFPGRLLRSGELVERVIRRSVWSWLSFAALVAALWLLPFFFLFPLLRRGQWGALAFSGGLIVAALATWQFIRRFRWNALVFTSERLLFLRTDGWLGTVQQEVPYEMVNALSVTRGGTISRALGLGWLRCASGQDQMSLGPIRRPEEVAIAIRQRQDRWRIESVNRRPEGWSDQDLERALIAAVQRWGQAEAVRRLQRTAAQSVRRQV